MHSNQTDIIRYVMDEMDPSEKLSFEKKLDSDENLLIEVETFKNTWKRTKTTPNVEAPKILQEQIMAQALTNSQAKSFSPFGGLIMRHKYKIAAGFMLVFTALFSWRPDVFFDHSNEMASKNIESSTTVESKGILSQENKGSTVPLAEDNTTNAIQLKPWVDDNQVIRFAGTSDFEVASQPSLNLSSEFSSKLRLVNDKTGYNSQSRKILLTGNTPN